MTALTPEQRARLVEVMARAMYDAIDCMERVRSYPVARRENPYRGRRK